MCDHTNEQNDMIQFLVNEIDRLENELLESRLSSIEARNPGIDIEEVRRTMIERRESMKEVY
jgi:hypothetical protein